MSTDPPPPSVSGDHAPPNLPRPDLMTTQEVADWLGIPEDTLKDWRSGHRQWGSGPPYARFGRYVKYRRGDVQEWFEGRFEPPIYPPASGPPDHATAAGRYFPWCVIAEAVAETVADELNAPPTERTRIVNAVWAALPDAYQAYMNHLGKATHADAEAEALRQLRDALDQHLHSSARTRNPGPGAEAS
jgi:hypothetical protein